MAAEAAQCEKCGRAFLWVERGPTGPGGKEREQVNCPYCGETYYESMINGTFMTMKMEPAAEAAYLAGLQKKD